MKKEEILTPPKIKLPLTKTEQEGLLNLLFDIYDDKATTQQTKGVVEMLISFLLSNHSMRETMLSWSVGNADGEA